MFRKSLAGITAGLAVLVASLPATAQTHQCTGLTTCSVTVTASLEIPALLSLTVGDGTGITLAAPDEAAFEAGFKQSTGPAISVKANRSWTLSIHTTAENFTHADDATIVKPASDLLWSDNSSSGFTAINNAPAQVTTGSRTSAGAPAIYFRTLYASNPGDDRNAAGVFTIPLVFTLSAP